MYFLLLLSTFGLIKLEVAVADEWLKINHPDQATKLALKDQGLHYENFIFIQQDQVNSISIINHAQPVDRPFHFLIDDEYIDLTENLLPQTPWFSATNTDAPAYYLVQFNGPIKPTWLANLQQQGIKLISPMAPFSWIVWADSTQVSTLTRDAGIRHWNYFYPAFRVQAQNRVLPNHEIPSMALVYQPKLVDTINQLQSLGGTNISSVPINEHLSALNFSISGSSYLAAAQVSGLLTVQKIQQDAGLRGEMSQQSIVGNYDENNVVQTGYQDWLDDTGLDGNGVVVSVVDGGIYQNHPDLGNVVACTGTGASCNDSSDSHGTHVAGAIGGTGENGSTNAAGFNRGLGVAPGTEIVEQLYAPLLGGGPGGMVAGGMLSIYKDSATSGAMLSNNSWGPTGTPQGYDIPTMEVDMISRDANPD
ncbi:MAG: S8 family serine peptidase, partial [Marinicella sp.]